MSQCSNAPLRRFFRTVRPPPWDMVDTDTPTLLQNTLAGHLTQYTALAAYSILYYDYTLTLSTEIERFWTRRLTWASFFFFLNRYFALLGHIPTIWQYFWSSSDIAYNQRVCHILSLYHQYFSIVIQAIAGAMLVLRTYALYASDRRILRALGIIALAVVAVACWSILTEPKSRYESPYPTCSITMSMPDAIHLVIAWSGMIVFDAIVFMLTVWKAFHVIGSIRSGLVHRLMRDGAIYFAMVTLANIFDIITLIHSYPEARGFGTTLSNVLSSTLISRLYLNLRDPSHASRGHATSALAIDSDPFVVARGRRQYNSYFSDVGVLSTIPPQPEIELVSIGELASTSADVNDINGRYLNEPPTLRGRIQNTEQGVS